MKTKVNSQWYAQCVRFYKNEIGKEKLQIRRQFRRYSDAISGNMQQFDIDHDISIEKLFMYLENAIFQVGHAEHNLNKIIKNYDPDDSIKIDWKGIESEIKEFSIKYNGVLCDSDNKYLEFVGGFFSEAKWGVPDTKKNNDRLYKILFKYECCFDEHFQ